jgi:AcrR family transcriptional regulator
MTTTPASRRALLRVATAAEIKQSARRLLVSGGPPAISLRAIGRDLGMTAPAIYRYFPSLDALVTALCVDLYHELAKVLEATGDIGRPSSRLAEMTREFRRWSVSHPAEFTLVFANPVAGEDGYEEGSKLYAAQARFGAAFLDPFAELWRRHPVPVPPARTLSAHLQPYFAMHGRDLPVDAVYLVISGWARLYGLVALEVFGHLQWAMTDAEPYFEAELALFLSQFGG